MKLTTEDLGYFANIDAAKLRQVLADEAFGSFAIIEVCEGTFLQAGQGDAWSLEYRENSSAAVPRAWRVHSRAGERRVSSLPRGRRNLASRPHLGRGLDHPGNFAACLNHFASCTNRLSRLHGASIQHFAEPIRGGPHYSRFMLLAFSLALLSGQTPSPAPPRSGSSSAARSRRRSSPSAQARSVAPRSGCSIASVQATSSSPPRRNTACSASGGTPSR